VRPLLEIERCDIERYLNDRGIPWREDSSNATARFARNRIRHALLPQLACEWNPEMVRTLAQTADWALAEEAYWGAELDRLAALHLSERDGFVLAPVQALGEMPVAASRRLVRRAIERAKGDLRAVDFSHVERVLELAVRPQGHGRLNLPGLRVIRSFGWLRFGKPEEERRDYSFPVQVPGVYRIPGTGLSIDLELLEKPKTSDLSSCVYNSVMGCLDWHSLPGSLELRNWRAGDQYRPRESSGVEKLKTLFQKARIPVWERRQWPVLAAGSSIVWVRRFGAAEQFAAGPASDWILRVRDA
jgi:tRNA(Ile)-lysidine synthase